MATTMMHTHVPNSRGLGVGSRLGDESAVGVFVVQDVVVLRASARFIRPPWRATLLAARDGRDLVLHRIRAGESGKPPSEGLPYLVVGLALIGLSCDISMATKMRQRVIETRGCKGSRFYLR